MGINISIVAGKDRSGSSVQASGTVRHVITDEERTTFHIGDKQLKDAVKADFGKSPNDAYLHSNTPWGDLYKTYKWPQVQMVLFVQDAKILGITSEPVIVKTQEFANNSSQKATFNVEISESVNNTTSSTWSKVSTLTIGQKFSYDVNFLGSGGGGETSMSYSEAWGSGGAKSKSIALGSTCGVTVELDPGESVVARLSASRGTMKVQIRYKAYLTGMTAVNYNPTWKGHHFWALPVSRVMSAGCISNSVESIEDIEIGYYSNSKIELKDKKTDALKSTHSLDDLDLPGEAWVRLYDDKGIKDRMLEIIYPRDIPDMHDVRTTDGKKGFNDKASSAIWKIPKGLKFVLYDDKNYKDRRYPLVGTGKTEGCYEFKNFNDKCSSGRWEKC